MQEELLSKLIEFVQTTSPVIWQAAYRQVYVQIWGNIFLGVLILVPSIFGIYTLRLKFRKWRELEDMALVIFSFYTLAILAGILSITLAVQQIINPQWYAIKLLWSLVK